MTCGQFPSPIRCLSRRIPISGRWAVRTLCTLAIVLLLIQPASSQFGWGNHGISQADYSGERSATIDTALPVGPAFVAGPQMVNPDPMATPTLPPVQSHGFGYQTPDTPRRIVPGPVAPLSPHSSGSLPQIPHAEHPLITLPQNSPQLASDESPFSYFGLMGEVMRPGVYEIPSGDPLLIDVVQKAGGLTRSASGNIRIVRRGRAGQQTFYSPSLQFRLHPGDILIADRGRVAAKQHPYDPNQKHFRGGSQSQSARIETDDNTSVQLAFVNLIERPVVLRVRRKHANLPTIISLLGQSPTAAESVRILTVSRFTGRVFVSDQNKTIPTGSVLVFDPRTVTSQKIPKLPEPVSPQPPVAEAKTANLQAIPPAAVQPVQTNGPVPVPGVALLPASPDDGTPVATTPSRPTELPNLEQVPDLVQPPLIETAAVDGEYCPAPIGAALDTTKVADSGPSHGNDLGILEPEPHDEAFLPPLRHAPSEARERTKVVEAIQPAPILSPLELAPPPSEKFPEPALAKVDLPKPMEAPAPIAPVLPTEKTTKAESTSLWTSLFQNHAAILVSLISAFVIACAIAMLWSMARTVTSKPETVVEKALEQSGLKLDDLIENRVDLDCEEVVLPATVNFYGKPNTARVARIDAAHMELKGPHFAKSFQSSRQTEPAGVKAEQKTAPQPSEDVRIGLLERVLSTVHGASQQ